VSPTLAGAVYRHLTSEKVERLRWEGRTGEMKKINKLLNGDGNKGKKREKRINEK
jgi:hypothetical protein